MDEAHLVEEASSVYGPDSVEEAGLAVEETGGARQQKMRDWRKKAWVKLLEVE